MWLFQEHHQSEKGQLHHLCRQRLGMNATLAAKRNNLGKQSSALKAKQKGETFGLIRKKISAFHPFLLFPFNFLTLLLFPRHYLSQAKTMAAVTHKHGQGSPSCHSACSKRHSP